MFQSLSERLSQSLRSITGKARLTEENIQETLREVRMALLEADVALPVVKEFVDRVRERAVGAEVAKSLSPGQAFVKIIQAELERVLGGETAELDLLTDRTGRVPILLLDDVSSELDRSRNRRFFRMLSQVGGQVFMTTTHPEFILLESDRIDFQVEGGRVSR